MTTAATKLLAVLGHPIAHSKSPAMHSVWLRRYNIPARYLAFDVLPEDLPHAIRGLQVLGAIGCNITLPHKEAALALCHEVSPHAQALGAVNTLIFQKDKIIGDNTDGFGFWQGLITQAPCPVPHRPIVILGAGGAARGVVAALSDHVGCPLIILNRTLARAEALRTLAPNLTTGPLNTPLPPDAQMVVNTLSSGAAVPDLSALPTDCLLYDLSYNPPVTPFLAAGQQRGLRGINGAAMLAHQGAAAFALWFQHTPAVDEEVMRVVLGYSTPSVI
jgi:shikimate dehydrogenase